MKSSSSSGALKAQAFRRRCEVQAELPHGRGALLFLALGLAEAQGEAINFEGFTPYWPGPTVLSSSSVPPRCRAEQPESFRRALTAPCGPRKVRPIAGGVKFGKSRLHGRGVFADASYKRGELLELCPCLILDTNGANCMQDHCFQLPEVKLEVEGACGSGEMHAKHRPFGHFRSFSSCFHHVSPCFFTNFEAEAW